MRTNCCAFGGKQLMVCMHCSKKPSSSSRPAGLWQKPSQDSNAQSADTSHKAAACALKLEALRRTNMAPTAGTLMANEVHADSLLCLSVSDARCP